jgi:Protein of unknown function (DUF1553)/Protein of unknown function (DUF1549)
MTVRCCLSVVILLFAVDGVRGDAPLPSAAVRWSAKGKGGAPSFVKHVVPLFSKVGCSSRSCHGSFQGQGGFRLSLFGYDPRLDHKELTADEGKGPRVNPKDVDKSRALLKPLGKLDHGGGKRFEPGSWQHRLFRAWIAAGAKYDPATALYLKRLTVAQREFTLRPKQTVRLKITAEFNDGVAEDVTPLTTFSSNDESVATVSDDATVTAVGTGDTSIVVTYAGGVVTAQVIVPNRPSQPFPRFPPNNKVDEFVAAKLRKVGVHPSGLCSDEVFLRRVYVDAIGTLPTAKEAREFLADKRPDKRRRLIDRLLDRDEYALYWATLFSDWTGNNRVNVNNFWKVSWLWHSWLRDKFARNVPYDRLAKGIVVATSREGRPLDAYLKENKAVAAATKARGDFDTEIYARRKTLDQYWLKRMGDRDKGLAIRTANTFLGLQIQCAECHKHPFDRWTQDDFEGFTSFFRVVQITELDGSPRVQRRYDYDKVALYTGVERRYKRKVQQHPPKILAGPVVPYKDGGKDPRLTLWEWMTSKDNPYFARNIANRLWAHYFGKGIVDPVDDLNAANPPSNPELLDWLAKDFVAHKFDLKHLHRRILNSRTYQLSYRPNATNRGDHRNFSHAQVRRMKAEVALDAVVQVTGTKLRWNNYAAPAGVRAIGLAAPTRYGQSEYFLEVFGRPKRVQTCACERSDEASLAQALFMINDNDMQTRIADRKGRLAKLLRTIKDDRQLIEELYLTTLSRYPKPAEMKTALDYVKESDTRESAIQDVLWSLLNVREFLFVR